MSSKNSILEIQLGNSSSEESHTCDVCNETFPKMLDLITHLLIHTSENDLPFACNECDKTFSRKEHLKRHQLVHTSEKPFICNECR